MEESKSSKEKESVMPGSHYGKKKKGRKK